VIVILAYNKEGEKLRNGRKLDNLYINNKGMRVMMIITGIFISPNQVYSQNLSQNFRISKVDNQLNLTSDNQLNLTSTLHARVFLPLNLKLYHG